MTENNHAEFYGQAIALIFGEVYYFNLSYNDQEQPILTVDVRYKRRNAKKVILYWANRIVFLKDDAIRLARTLVKHNNDTHTNGTFIAALSTGFGSKKNQDGTWGHQFLISKYRIFDTVEEFNSVVESNQDPLVLRLGDILGLE